MATEQEKGIAGTKLQIKGQRDKDAKAQSRKPFRSVFLCLCAFVPYCSTCFLTMGHLASKSLLLFF
jgi:hypothetical protein